MNTTREELLQMLDAITPRQREILDEGLGVQEYMLGGEPGALCRLLAEEFAGADREDLKLVEYYWIKRKYLELGQAVARVLDPVLETYQTEYKMLDKVMEEEKRRLPFTDDLEAA